MTDTSVVYLRTDNNLKENAKSILKLPTTKPLVLGNMTATELNEELNKGLASLANGKGISTDDFDSILNKEFGI